MMDKFDYDECEDKCKCNESLNERGVYSVFSTLLHRNSKCAEIVLNEQITTNEQDLDSSDLLIVYNLGVFGNESDVAKNDATDAIFENNPDNTESNTKDENLKHEM